MTIVPTFILLAAVALGPVALAFSNRPFLRSPQPAAALDETPYCSSSFALLSTRGSDRPSKSTGSNDASTASSSTTSAPAPSSAAPGQQSRPAPGVRLNKVLKETHSRRQADALIVAGRVTVNGAVAADTPGMRVTATDQVQLDGQTVRWAQQVLESPAYDYIKYWKPLGVICTTDRRIAGNILDTIELTDTLGKLPSRRIYPVGRLDKDTSGLILLTSDGRLPNSVLRGAQKQPKTYRVQVHKPLTVAALEALAAGVVITTQAQRDGKRPPALTARTLPCTCLQIADQTLEITLREGRNRQVRKMLEAVGYQVLKLHRTTFMGMDLAELQGPGDWSRLSAADEQDVVNAIEMQQAQMQPSGDDANDDEETLLD